MTQEISKGKIGNGKWLGLANYNINLKNNFSRLVMNVTQINFLYWQNVYIWRIIKVHHMLVIRSSANINYMKQNDFFLRFQR